MKKHRAFGGISLFVLVAVLGGLAGLPAGCDRNSGASVSEGILLVVTLAGDSASRDLNENIDELHFFIGYEVTEGTGYVLAGAQQGPSAIRNVAGRSLGQEPWREFVTRTDPSQTRIRAYVLAYRDDVIVGWGQLLDENGQPDTQLFLDGAVVERRIEIVAVESKRPPFVVTETGCLIYAEPLTPEGGQTGADDILLRSPEDFDCDGYLPPLDCDDTNPDVNPGAKEICDNGRDDDCTGSENDDADGDGYQSCDPDPALRDCNDNDPYVHPGQQEICNGKDDDCNGLCDDGFDLDGDGWNTCGTWQGPQWDKAKCVQEPSLQDRFRDCFDGTSPRTVVLGGETILVNPADVNPGAFEVCNGFDDNCDGVCDNENTGNGVPLLDPDRDGWTECGTWNNGMPHCAEDARPDWRDCLPDKDTVYPGAHERCNGIDDNCDGECDEGFDFDGDGWNRCGTQALGWPLCEKNPEDADCDETADWVHPGAVEICDGRDTDCDPDSPFVAPQIVEPCPTFDRNIQACRQATLACDDTNRNEPVRCEGQQEWLLPDSVCAAFDSCKGTYLDNPYQDYPSGFGNFDGDFLNTWDCTLAESNVDDHLPPSRCRVRKRNRSHHELCTEPKIVVWTQNTPGGTVPCPRISYVWDGNPDWEVYFVSALQASPTDPIDWNGVDGDTIDPCATQAENIYALVVAPNTDANSWASDTYVTIVWEDPNGIAPTVIGRLHVSVNWGIEEPDCLDSRLDDWPTPGLECDPALSAWDIVAVPW